eukprot:scaffold12181_cov213-Isochrysis_galbana.AAC.2
MSRSSWVEIDAPPIPTELDRARLGEGESGAGCRGAAGRSKASGLGTCRRISELLYEYVARGWTGVDLRGWRRATVYTGSIECRLCACACCEVDSFRSQQEAHFTAHSAPFPFTKSCFVQRSGPIALLRSRDAVRPRLLWRPSWQKESAKRKARITASQACTCGVFYPARPRPRACACCYLLFSCTPFVPSYPTRLYSGRHWVLGARLALAAMSAAILLFALHSLVSKNKGGGTKGFRWKSPRTTH